MHGEAKFHSWKKYDGGNSLGLTEQLKTLLNFNKLTMKFTESHLTDCKVYITLNITSLL